MTRAAVHPEAARRRPGLRWRPDAPASAIERPAPTEAAIGLSFNGRPHAVLMATPADVQELAIGFTVTEGVAAPSEIMGVSVVRRAEGLLADVTLAPEAARRRARPRGLEGRSSCGLCGVQRLADAVRPLPKVASAVRFNPAAVQAAVDSLAEHQALGALTRATHAAGFADVSGALRMVREDVGRHNALDKLGGALIAAGLDPAAGFVVATSRCSFEMVEKTARLGAPAIVAVSAPTDLAIERAQVAGLTLIALARADGFTVFTHAERLGLSVAEASYA